MNKDKALFIHLSKFFLSAPRETEFVIFCFLLNQFVKFGHGTSNTLSAGVPNGYLKAVFFDKAGNVQAAESQVKYLQTSVSSWQTLELSFTASQNGYLQVYVANESDQEVFFDELEVAHTPTLIAQENHYYPYGMNMVGIEKQGMPHNRFQFNAQTERETSFHLHWDETPFRRYDAQIGRFHGVDALASSYAGITPYQYGFNNPVMFNDPSGLKPTPGVGDGSSLSVTDRMFGDFLGGSSFSNRGTSATGDGWQRRQEQDELARTLNPWDYTTNVTNIVKSKAFRGFDENANVLFQMASIVGGYDGGEDLPELRLRLITIYTHANLDKMRIERGISQMKQAIYDGQGRFINRSLEYINLASTIADVAGIAGLAKAGGKFLVRQALKRFGRRSVQTFDNVALSQAEQAAIKGGTRPRFGPNIIEATSEMSIAANKTRLYRVVSAGELDDIGKHGYRLAKGYDSGKLFATSAEDAVRYGRLFFKSGEAPLHLTSVTISNRLYGKLFKFTADGMTAVNVSSRHLKIVNKFKIQYYNQLPNVTHGPFGKF